MALLSFLDRNSVGQQIGLQHGVMHQLAGIDLTALQHPQVKVGVLKDQREVTLLHVLLEFLPVRLIERLEVEVEGIALTPELNEANELATVERKRRKGRLSVTSSKGTKKTKIGRDGELGGHVCSSTCRINGGEVAGRGEGELSIKRLRRLRGRSHVAVVEWCGC